MKRLKKILPYKYLVLILITLIYVYLITSNLIYKTNYDVGYNEIKGVVIDIDKNEDKTVFILKAKEKIRVISYEKLNIEIGDVLIVSGNLEIPLSNTVFNLL